MISAMDKKDLKITKAQTHADGKKYFSVFEKHIPAGLADDSKVLLYALGNIDCIYRIISKNPSAEYFIYDSKHIVNAVKLLFEDVDVTKTEDIYNINDMMFDCIIMYPPCRKNLHLKILAEAITHLKDDNSKVVNLSPDTWLYPTAEFNKKSDYNKFKDITFDNVEQIGPLNRFFDINRVTYSGAIYIASKHGTFDISKLLCGDILASLSKQFIIPKKLVSLIKDKVFNVIAVNHNLSTATYVKHGEVDKHTKYTRFIPCLVGSPGERCNCIASIGSKRWDRTFYQGMSEGKTMGEYKKKLSNVTNYTSFNYIEFDTEIEATNWRNINTTYFMQLICLITHRDSNANLNWLPWMGNSINPRTGLNGYQGEWTNEDLCQFFSITDDEKKIIEDTMAKYTK